MLRYKVREYNKVMLINAHFQRKKEQFQKVHLLHRLIVCVICTYRSDHAEWTN